MDYPLLSPSAMQEADGMPMEHPDMKVEKLYKFLMSIFPGKESLKPEKNCKLWNPIFNYALGKLDCCDRDSGVSRYSSIKE